MAGTRRKDPSQYDFRKQLFDEVLLPTSGSKRRSSVRTRKIRHIDIHHMTVKDSDNGAANFKCLDIWDDREASAHYCVDNRYVLQAVYDNRMAWGNGNGTANQEGIIVEHANSSLAPTWGISEATLETSAKLVAGLHLTHKLGRPTSTGFGTGGTIRTHQSFFATACPGPYFKKVWSRYVGMVQAAYDAMVKGGSTPTQPTPVSPPANQPITGPTYAVAAGDTLSSIAGRIAKSTTWRELAAWNGLKDPNRIEPGQVLRLTKPTTPEPEPTKPKSQDIRVMVVNAASRNPNVIKAMGPWKGDRVDDLAAYILKHKPDYVGAVELYAADRPLLDKQIVGTEPGTYARIGVKGGRVAYLLRGSGVVVGGSVWTDLLPGKGTKYALARKIRFSQGAIGNFSVGHLSYETSATGVRKRAKEAPAWIAWVRKRFPTDFDLYMGDVNSPAGATTRADDVGPIFARHNLRDLRHDVKVAIGKGRYHLIRLFGGLVKAKSITTEPVSFSDHPVVHATVTIPIA